MKHPVRKVIGRAVAGVVFAGALAVPATAAVVVAQTPESAAAQVGVDYQTRRGPVCIPSYRRHENRWFGFRTSVECVPRAGGVSTGRW